MKFAAIVDKIEEAAAGYSPKRAALTALALPVVAVVFVVALLVRAVWFVATRAWAAAVVAWRLAGAPSRGS